MKKKRFIQSNDKNLSFSICIPVYKGSSLLRECLQSIVKQGFTNYEIIIGEDTPPEYRDEIKKTQEVIQSFPNHNTQYFKNKMNLGYPKNLQKIVSLAKNDIIFLMGQDDILSRNALQKTHDAFFLGSDIGAVTRPYFWFDDDVMQPVRAITPANFQRDSVLSIFDGDEAMRFIFDSLGQLSGLALRRKFIDTPFNDDVFPAHIYPFAGIIKKHKCVFLKDYTVAVRIKSSQARSITSIYNVSPLQTWINMFNTVYKGKKYDRVRLSGIKHIVKHYVGLVQIKNFGPKGAVKREISKILHYRWQSIFYPQFWLYSLLALFMPRSILVHLADNYKKYMLSKFIKKIHFQMA